MSAIIFSRKLKLEEVKELPRSFGQKLRQLRLTFRSVFPQKALLTCASGCPENAKPGAEERGWLGEARAWHHCSAVSRWRCGATGAALVTGVCAQTPCPHTGWASPTLGQTLHEVLPWEGISTHCFSDEEYEGSERLSYRPKGTQL